MNGGLQARHVMSANRLSSRPPAGPTSQGQGGRGASSERAAAPLGLGAEAALTRRTRPGRHTLVPARQKLLPAEAAMAGPWRGTTSCSAKGRGIKGRERTLISDSASGDNQPASGQVERLTSAILNLIMSFRIGQSALRGARVTGQNGEVGDHGLEKVGSLLDHVRLGSLLQQLIIA